jgi:glucose-1-phosphate thymidylyltransferase
MKGIILAGGNGTRLYPLTATISKQLLPVYDKPVIYYPLCTLMESGIQDILIISTPRDIPSIQNLLGDGHQLGIHIEYCVQHSPKGLPEAFILGENFIGNDSVCMILGDNFFHDSTLPSQIECLKTQSVGATVFGVKVDNPTAFGVINMDANGRVTELVEKPKNPQSPWAMVGLYYYDNRVVEFAKNLKPSKRGELEIVDLTQHYLNEQTLDVTLLKNDTTWFDLGTFDSLLNASHYVQMQQKNNNVWLGCPEIIAYKKGYIGENKLLKKMETIPNPIYKNYLNAALEHNFGASDHLPQN